MAKVKQTIVVKGKTKTRKGKTTGKRGNPNKCPVCGKFMKA